MAIRKPKAAVAKTGPMYDAMNAALAATMGQFTPGTIIKGTISAIRGGEVRVDIGYKSEGIVPANEFEDISTVKPGDVIDVLLVELEGENGMVTLSKRQADDKLRWDAVLTKYHEGAIVNGVIKSRVRGGLIVNLDGIEAFLPGSQVDIAPVHEVEPYLNQTFEFKVIKISAERRNIIVSRRELMEDRLADKKRDLLASISKGAAPRRPREEHHRLWRVRGPRRPRWPAAHHGHELGPREAPVRTCEARPAN